MATGKWTSPNPPEQNIQILFGHGDGTFEAEAQLLSVPLFEGQPCHL